MDLNRLVVTTVRPDSKATMRGSQGQRPRKKKVAVIVPPPHEGPDDSVDAEFVETSRAAVWQPWPLDQRADSPPIPLLNDEALERLDGPIGHDIGAWAELQALHARDMAADAVLPPPDGIAQTIEMNNNDFDNTLIDPAIAPRLHIRIRGENREIWKPGDGDGDETTDWYGRSGVLPMEQRWRVFQTDIGPISWTGENIPPKYVYLDDDSACQVLNSDIPRARICKFWPHDFGQPGKVRRFRAHIGRPAFQNEDAAGNERYHSTQLGGRAAAPYYFSGEPDYVAVRYRIPPKIEKPVEVDPAVAAREERKRKIDAILDAEPNRRAHGHNQYTPKDMLVKYGAPSGAKPVEKFHNLPQLPRPHHFLKSAKDPIFTEKRLFGGIAESARESVRKDAQKAQQQALREASLDSLRAALREREREATQPSDGADEHDNENTFPVQRPEQTPNTPTITHHLPPISSPLPNSISPRPIEPPIIIPRNLSFIERRDIEQRIATQTLQSIQSQDDVKALAEQLAVEKVKVGQQEKTFARLEQKLKLKEMEVEGWREVAEEKEMQIEGLLESVKERE
ncbi:hypothetical protein Slin14017_G075890 [Septoria linicola]|nr:hypothetical protein Slin14017_G075890 [Septoria linicola]